MVEETRNPAVAEMVDRSHNRHGPKRGRGLLCPFRGELGLRLIQRDLGRGLLRYQVASSSIRPLGHNRHKPLLVGWVCPFSGGAGSPSNTKSPGPRPTSIPSGIIVHPAVWPQRTLAENWGAVPFSGGGAGFPSNTMWPGRRHISVPSAILIHPAIWPQQTRAENWGGGLRPLFGERELGPHLTQCGLAKANLRPKWHLDPCSRLTTINTGRKLGGSAPFGGGGWVPI